MHDTRWPFGEAIFQKSLRVKFVTPAQLKVNWSANESETCMCSKTGSLLQIRDFADSLMPVTEWAHCDMLWPLNLTSTQSTVSLSPIRGNFQSMCVVGVTFCLYSALLEPYWKFCPEINISDLRTNISKCSKSYMQHLILLLEILQRKVELKREKVKDSHKQLG